MSRVRLGSFANQNQNQKRSCDCQTLSGIRKRIRLKVKWVGSSSRRVLKGVGCGRREGERERPSFGPARLLTPVCHTKGTRTTGGSDASRFDARASDNGINNAVALTLGVFTLFKAHKALNTMQSPWNVVVMNVKEHCPPAS
jgi:hypothetical protein